MKTKETFERRAEFEIKEVDMGKIDCSVLLTKEGNKTTVELEDFSTAGFDDVNDAVLRMVKIPNISYSDSAETINNKLEGAIWKARKEARKILLKLEQPTTKSFTAQKPKENKDKKVA